MKTTKQATQRIRGTTIIPIAEAPTSDNADTATMAIVETMVPMKLQMDLVITYTMTLYWRL
jgi:hypothetical protein